jgi:hypothetical protein
MNDKKAIEAALDKLDHENDDDWTTGGLPSLDRVSEMVGRKVSRAEATEARADFVRSSSDRGRRGDKPVDPVEKPAPEEPVQPSVEDINKMGMIGEGNPMDAANNAERRILSEDDPTRPLAGADDRFGTAAELAEQCPDAIVLMEAAVAAGMTGRYTRNSTLQTLLRGYQAAQAEIKATQGRIDQRLGERAQAAEDAAKTAKAAEERSRTPSA